MENRLNGTEDSGRFGFFSTETEPTFGFPLTPNFQLSETLSGLPTPPGKSWIFFLENSRTWKVLENHFGKSWKLKLKVLEVLEKYP